MKRYRNVKLDTELQTINFDDEDLEFSEIDEETTEAADTENVEATEEVSEVTESTEPAIGRFFGITGTGKGIA